VEKWGIEIYDALANRVFDVEEIYQTGRNEFIWSGITTSGRQVPSGVYIYRITSGEKVLGGKMVFVKMISSGKQGGLIIRLVLTGGLVLLPLILLFSGCNKEESSVKEISFWGMGSEGEKIKILIPEFENKIRVSKLKFK
jgi:hypothetical protein